MSQHETPPGDEAEPDGAPKPAVRGGALGQGLPVSANLQLLLLNFLEDRPGHEATLADFMNHTGLSADTVTDIAKKLWFEGMVRRGGGKSPGAKVTGAKIHWGRAEQADPLAVPLKLTPLALEVLNDPDGAERWLNGWNPDPYRPQSRFEAAIFRKIGWPVTRLFLALIVMVFLGGLVYAATLSLDTAGDYLVAKESNPRVMMILETLGLEVGRDWEEGRWWRPLQANFVHIGLIHLLMNGLALWMLGGHVERVYGSLPFFFICIGGGWLGGCFHLAWSPFGGAGASAALSGVIAADGVWYLLNRGMLSRRIRQLWGQQVTVNTGMLVMISLMKGVSAAGHFGGALGGGLMALMWLGWAQGPQAPLTRVIRSLAMLGVLLVGGAASIRYGMENLESWDQYRAMIHYDPLEKEFLESVLNPVLDLQSQAIRPLERTHPSLRSAAKVAQTLAKIDEFMVSLDREKAKWESVPRSIHDPRPAQFASMLDALSLHLKESKDYLDSGLRMDPATRERLTATWKDFEAKGGPFFVIEEKNNPGLGEKKP